MSILNEWAERWGISGQAIEDLQNIITRKNLPTSNECKSEARVQSEIRLHAHKYGLVLWRNNVGACMDEHGNFIRYGLANDSKKVNEKTKSSDLIGIKRITITPEMVGRVFGQFTAFETKKASWAYRGDVREKAQLNFLNIVNGMGGYGKFISNVGDLDNV